MTAQICAQIFCGFRYSPPLRLGPGPAKCIWVLSLCRSHRVVRVSKLLLWSDISHTQLTLT